MKSVGTGPKSSRGEVESVIVVLPSFFPVFFRGDKGGGDGILESLVDDEDRVSHERVHRDEDLLAILSARGSFVWGGVSINSLLSLH